MELCKKICCLGNKRQGDGQKPGICSQVSRADRQAVERGEQ